MEFLIKEKQEEAIETTREKLKEELREELKEEVHKELMSRISKIANALFQQNNSKNTCIDQLSIFFPDVDLETILDVVEKVYNA